MLYVRALVAAVLAACALLATAATAAQAGTRRQMIDAINYVRSSQGRRVLAYSESLSRGASAWAHHLMSRQMFSHAAIPVGEGEIIEWHTGGSARVTSTVMEWWHSAEHRRVMMVGSFHRAGAGRATGIYDGRRCTIWVVRFR